MSDLPTGGDRSIKSESPHRLASLVTSDALPMLYELVSQVPAFAPFFKNHFQIRLVLDANFVHRELQWRLKSRRDPSARSAIHESIEAQVVVFFAPDCLESEIEEHLEDIARRSGTSTDAARAEWQSFRRLLHFYTPRSLELPGGTVVVDPDDLPYIAACSELGAHAVYTKDKHFQQMNAPVISIAIDAALRTYARGTSIRFAVMLGSTFSIALSVEAIKSAINLLGGAIQAFKKLHPALQFAIIAGLVYLFIEPRFRDKLATMKRALGRVAAPVLEAITLVARDFQIACVDVANAQKEILAVLPQPGRTSVLMRARAICATNTSPISLVELEQEMKRQGHQTKARHFRAYLRRVMRSSGQFLELPEGRWALRVESVVQSTEAGLSRKKTDNGSTGAG